DTTFRHVLTSGIRGALLFCPTRFLCSSDIRKTCGAQFPPAGWLGSITNSVCSSESRKRRIKSIQLPRYLISFNFQQRDYVRHRFLSGQNLITGISPKLMELRPAARLPVSFQIERVARACVFPDVHQT